MGFREDFLGEVMSNSGLKGEMIPSRKKNRGEDVLGDMALSGDQSCGRAHRRAHGVALNTSSHRAGILPFTLKKRLD